MREIKANGFAVSTNLWEYIKCFFGFHWWMCLTPIDEYGNYITCPQQWLCRHCSKNKKTYF